VETSLLLHLEKVPNQSQINQNQIEQLHHEKMRRILHQIEVLNHERLKSLQMIEAVILEKIHDEERIRTIQRWVENEIMTPSEVEICQHDELTLIIQKVDEKLMDDEAIDDKNDEIMILPQ
jgi:hypothetical protein